MTQDLRHRIETAAKRDAERQQAAGDEKQVSATEPSAADSGASADERTEDLADSQVEPLGESPSGSDSGSDASAPDGLERV